MELFKRSARPSPTGRAEIDARILSEAASAAFRDRLCMQFAESDYAVACIASPILDREERCVATISIVLPEQKVLVDQDRYADRIRLSAERVERSMGWRDH